MSNFSQQCIEAHGIHLKKRRKWRLGFFRFLSFLLIASGRRPLSRSLREERLKRIQQI